MVEKAVPLLKVPNGITRETAAGLIHNACAMVPSACDRVREAGALPLLMTLLTEDGCSYGQQVAAAAVRCLPSLFFCNIFLRSLLFVPIPFETSA